MKYGFNVAPIAAPRKQYGAGTLAMSMAGQAALTKATSGSGTMALALTGTLAGQAVPRVTGLIDMHLGVTGNLAGVFFMSGTARIALQATDHAVNPIAVKLAGTLPMTLAARYAIPANVMPRAGFDPISGRGFTATDAPRGFDVQPDPIEGAH